MAGLSNKDSSFFEIVSPDVGLDDKISTGDLISMTVNEKMSQLTQGTLSLHDPNHVYSRILRLGVKLRIAWGYKNADAHPRSLLAPIQNLDQFSESTERRGLEVLVESPSGGGSQTGVATYNCNFTSLGWRGDDEVRVFEEGTYADVVKTVLSELGVPPDQQIVRFSRGNTTIDETNSVRQWESNFAFLVRLASREWRAFFSMNYDQKGTLWARFVDPDLLPSTIAYQSAIMGVRGKSSILDYKGLVANVISYTWKNNAGKSGTGDGVNIVIVNGQPTFQRYNVETQTVVTWQLRPERIEAELGRKQNEAGVTGQITLVQDVLSASSFEEVQRFFEPIEQETAPQGYGYEVNLKMLGDPLFMAGNMVTFGEGFPDVLGNSQTNWYVESVSHTISQQGYMMDVHVADAYSFSPTGGLL